MKIWLALCAFLVMFHSAASAQQSAVDTMTPDAILENLKAAQYGPLETYADQHYQRFLAKDISEDALLDALYPFSQLNGTDVLRLEDWVKSQPESGIALLAQGYAYREKGWAARGNKYASETREAQFDEMNRWFRQARKSYEAANRMLKRCNLCYAGLINIAMAQGRTEAIRLLFKEVMASDPLADFPVYAYYQSLGREWDGAPGEQEAFAEQFQRMYPANHANRRIQAYSLLKQAGQAQEQGDAQGALALYDASLAAYEGAYAYSEKAALLGKLQRKQEALEAYSKAVAQWRRPSSMFDFEQRGWAYQQLGRFDEAAADLRKAVDLGSAWAFETLFRQYAGNSGYQVRPDPEKAFKLCNQAVLVGIPSAYWGLGGMYYFGRGTPRVPEKAAAWFERASANGIAGAKTDLGIMLWQGDGIPQNRKRAIALWREAAQLGDPRGEAKLQGNLSSLEYFWHVTVQGWLDKMQQQFRMLADFLKLLRSSAGSAAY